VIVAIFVQQRANTRTNGIIDTTFGACPQRDELVMIKLCTGRIKEEEKTQK
jgi:hypothetical protein